VAATQLNGALAASAPTVTVDSTTGCVVRTAVIYDNNQFDIFTYTGTTATTVTGVSVLIRPRTALAVETLYATPSDFGRTRPRRSTPPVFATRWITVDGFGRSGAGHATGSTFSLYQSSVLVVWLRK